MQLLDQYRNEKPTIVFVDQLIEAWNTKNIDLILSFYDNAILYHTPYAKHFLQLPDNQAYLISNMTNLKKYFQQVFEHNPNHVYAKQHVFSGPETVVLVHHSFDGSLVAETMFLTEKRKIRRVYVDYLLY
jgi:hypothetical protein